MCEIVTGVQEEERGIRFLQEPDRGLAIRRAVKWARPGDTVVVLGKGHEQSIVVDDRKEPWNDVMVVQQALDEIR